MSSKKKTGDKLVASVRKSKTGSVAKKTSQRPNASLAARPKAAAGGAAAKAGTGKTAASTTTATSKVRKKGYSLGRRVWPD